MNVKSGQVASLVYCTTP